MGAPQKGRGYSSVAARMTVGTTMDQAGDERAAKEAPRGGARTVGTCIVTELFRMHASFGCDVTTKARQLLLLVDAQIALSAMARVYLRTAGGSSCRQSHASRVVVGVQGSSPCNRPPRYSAQCGM